MRTRQTILLFALAVALAQSAFGANFRHRRPALVEHATALASGGKTDDPAAISLDPSLSSLCQSLIGRVDIYADPRPNIDAIAGDAIVTSGSQVGCGAAQNSPSIAVNPENPLHLVVTANDYRLLNSRQQRNEGSAYAYVSVDGGRTWSHAPIPHLTMQTGATGALSIMDVTGAPSIAFASHDVVYAANVVLSRTHNASGVVVSKSADGGHTWSEPAIVQLDGGNANVSNDSVSIAVDSRSDALFVAWTRFGESDPHPPDSPTGSPIAAARSIDGGRTWSKFALVNSAANFRPGGVTPFSQGASARVGPAGELYIAYEAAMCLTLACDGASDHDAIVVATSFDGGRTFINTEVATVYDFPTNADTGALALTGEHFRVNSFPQVAIDSVTGKLYVVWADDRHGEYSASGGSIRTNGDVFIVGSFDGFHWSQPKQIGGGQDEFFPAVAAYGGQVAVTFYTRNFDASGIGVDVALVSAADFSGLNGLAHVSMRRVTLQSEDPQVQFAGVGAVSGNVLQGVFAGDRIAIAVGSDGTLHPCWTDFRGKPGATAPNQDIYTQAIRWDD